MWQKLSASGDLRLMQYRFQYNPDLDLSGTSGSHLAETLQQLYSSSNVGYVIWNDQPLSKSKVKPKALHAHAKGEYTTRCHNHKNCTRRLYQQACFNNAFPRHSFHPVC